MKLYCLKNTKNGKRYVGFTHTQESMELFRKPKSEEFKNKVRGKKRTEEMKSNYRKAAQNRTPEHEENRRKAIKEWWARRKEAHV